MEKQIRQEQCSNERRRSNPCRIPMRDNEQSPPDPLKVTGWSSGFPASASHKLCCNNPNYGMLPLGSDSKIPASQPPTQANVDQPVLIQLQTASAQAKTSERRTRREILPTGVHTFHWCTSVWSLINAPELEGRCQTNIFLQLQLCQNVWVSAKAWIRQRRCSSKNKQQSGGILLQKGKREV